MGNGEWQVGSRDWGIGRVGLGATAPPLPTLYPPAPTRPSPSQHPAHRQRRNPGSVRLGVVACAPADFAKAKTAVERERRSVSVIDLEMDAARPGPHEFLEMMRKERDGVAAAPSLRAHCDA